jgi:hypothetical protein
MLMKRAGLIVWLAAGVLTAIGLAAETEAEKPAEKPLPASVRVTRQMEAATLAPAERQFVVACRVVGKDDAKRGGGALSFSLPEITVRDGEKVTLEDAVTESHVVAYKSEAGRRLPITRPTKTGSVFEVTVIGVDDEQVVLDLTATFLGHPSFESDKQLVNKRFLGTRAQIVDQVPLGKAVSLRLSEAGGTVEVVVRERRAAAEKTALRVSAARSF